MADISEYLETLRTAIYGEDMRGAIIGAITLLSKANTNTLEYIKERISISKNETYTIPTTAIAQNSPVTITISGGGGNTTLIRADGEALVDKLTGNTVDKTMTEVEITADDVVTGVKLTEGGTLTVKYYNKNCEDLLRRIGLTSTFKTVKSGTNAVTPDISPTPTPYTEGEI